MILADKTGLLYKLTQFGPGYQAPAAISNSPSASSSMPWVQVVNCREGSVSCSNLMFAAIQSDATATGKIFVSTDGGTSWSSQQFARPFTSISCVIMSCSRPLIVAVSSNQDVLIINDATVLSSSTSSGQALDYTAVTITTANGIVNIFATVKNGNIMVSNDSGQSFQSRAFSKNWTGKSSHKFQCMYFQTRSKCPVHQFSMLESAAMF
jgi:hypothetical protein